MLRLEGEKVDVIRFRLGENKLQIILKTATSQRKFQNDIGGLF